jgi:hypothetical protein
MNKPTNRWTREELKVYDHGFFNLAKAVIKQWNDDGKPKVNRESIEAWAQVMLELSHNN